MAARRPAKSPHKLYWLLLASHFGAVQVTQAAENEQVLQIPDLELLEFLGSFQTDNGDWIEPESLLTGEFAELLNLAAEMDAAAGENTDGSNEEPEVNDQSNN